MSIVSSVITATDVQTDGRKWVRELHTDQVGLQYARTYLAGAADDLNAALAAYATVLAGNIAAREISKDLVDILANGSQATQVTTIYVTTAQAGAAVRAAYATATQVQAIMLGDYLSTLSDAQLQSLFSMTSGQVTTLRANKLTPAASAAATIRAAAGQ